MRMFLYCLLLKVLAVCKKPLRLSDAAVVLEWYVQLCVYKLLPTLRSINIKCSKC